MYHELSGTDPILFPFRAPANDKDEVKLYDLSIVSPQRLLGAGYTTPQGTSGQRSVRLVCA